MKGKKLIEFFDHGIFPGLTCVIIGYTVKEAIDYINSNIGNNKEYNRKRSKGWLSALSGLEVPNECSGYTTVVTSIDADNNEKYYYFLIIPEPFYGTMDNYNVLAHELIHVTQFFLPGILDVNKEIEAQAYLHSYLFEKICRKMGFK